MIYSLLMTAMVGVISCVEVGEMVQEWRGRRSSQLIERCRDGVRCYSLPPPKEKKNRKREGIDECRCPLPDLRIINNEYAYLCKPIL